MASGSKAGFIARSVHVGTKVHTLECGYAGLRNSRRYGGSAQKPGSLAYAMRDAMEEYVGQLSEQLVLEVVLTSPQHDPVARENLSY